MASVAVKAVNPDGTIEVCEEPPPAEVAELEKKISVSPFTIPLGAVTVQVVVELLAFCV